MTLELFGDFLRRIEANEAAPEEFRSDFWSGGMPYLSISHYPDFNGDGVPGDVEVVYVDGNYLKAKGTYRDTPLGRACFKAICDDLYNTQKSENKDKVRVSIAFLDWKHKHKSNGFIFERESLHSICPECLRELVTGDYQGKEFLRGQLIHLAHTRVPVNKRTLMEVDKSMATTRKDDAASIVGDELADELEKKAKAAASVSKSEALVVKADDDQDDVADLPEVERAVTKKEGGCEHPASHYLIVEDPEKVTTWHLRVKDCEGNIDNRLLGAAKAALTAPGGHRGQKYEGPNKEEAIRKLKRLYKEQGLEWKSDVDDEDDPVIHILNELKSEISQLKSIVPAREPVEDVHPLHEYIEKFKAEFDTVLAMGNTSPEDKLRAVQPAFDTFGQSVAQIIKASSPVSEPSAPASNDFVSAFSEALQPLMKELGMLRSEISALKRPETSPVQQVIPQRRSVTPTLQMQDISKSLVNDPRRPSTPTPKLRQIIERTT
jgi:hypothetical protein